MKRKQHPLDLANLESGCETCNGTGNIEVAGVYPKRKCNKCKGIGCTPTVQGRVILSFINRHLKIGDTAAKVGGLTWKA